MRWNVWAAITGKLKMYFHLDKITKLRKVTPDFFLKTYTYLKVGRKNMKKVHQNSFFLIHRTFKVSLYDYLIGNFCVSFFLSKTFTELQLGSQIIACTADPRPTGILQENVTIVFSYNEVFKFSMQESEKYLLFYVRAVFKTKVINLANHNRCRQTSELMRTHSNT